MSDTTNPEEVIIIPQGKVRCYITGELRNDKPEERVRQNVLRSLVEEYGYLKDDIQPEFSIKMGSSRKAVDVAIFEEGSDHIQENIYLICETKHEKVSPSDKKEGVAQLESYVAACLNTEFALWVGSERLPYSVKSIDSHRSLVEIPDIPKAGENDIPRPTRADLVPAVNLKKVFKRIHNYIYANQGFQKPEAFEELLKIIFVKVFDEQFSPNLKFYTQHPDEDIEAVYQRITDLFGSVQARYQYIFKPNEEIALNKNVLNYVVSELQRFSFIETETDIKGEAYEELVGPNLRGDRGEFFTPRNLCNMTVEMVFNLFNKEDLSTPGRIKILDPACGTGGFLISCLQALKSIYYERGVRSERLKQIVKEVAENNIYGVDFNPFLVNVAQMNMVMHGDGSTNVVHANSLNVPDNWNNEASEVLNLNTYDIIVTNPPFGTKSLITEPSILEEFEIARNSNGLPPEQLFIERCLQLLKPGGILGIVLPDSILTNPGLIELRNWISANSQIIASIDLPSEMFQPSTGTQTSVLILKKITGANNNSGNIFMAIPKMVGHDKRGNPIYVTTPEGEIEVDETGLEIIDDHLPIIPEVFDDWLKAKGIK